MSFAVIHMQKIKGNGVTGMQIHNQREKESDTNTDIKKDQSHLNYDLENENEIDYHEKINSMIEERVDQSQRKVRKDAVKVASFMVTSDKEFFDGIGPREEKRFFETAHKFIGDRYGKENVAYAMVHKDEKTPHMHLGLVPITEDGRLSAKDFFGKKQQLHSLQDDFHSHMKENGFDLERGISSDKKHLDTAKFKLQTTQEKVTGLEKEIKSLHENLEKIRKVEQRIERVDDIDNKVKEGRFSNKITIDKEDFKAFKNVAKTGIATLQQNKILEEKLEDLKTTNSTEIKMLTRDNKIYEKSRNQYMDRNQELLKENSLLKSENKFLKKQYENIKGFVQNFTTHLDKSMKKVAEKFNSKEIYKAFIQDSYNPSMKFGNDEMEKQLTKDKKELQKNNEKENELE